MCSPSRHQGTIQVWIWPRVRLGADLQLQKKTTRWQALPSVRKVLGGPGLPGLPERSRGSEPRRRTAVGSGHRATRRAWPGENPELMGSRVHLHGTARLPVSETASRAGPGPQPLKSPRFPPTQHPPLPPAPSIYLCHWTVLVTLKLRFTFSRTFISGSFMTLGECAKFLIRLARQPEAAAAPRSLHGLFALQHNKPLYSFEDNADYVYDVMWSPVHPALFACVDGMGRLDLWNLNNDTEVSGGAGARAGGLGGGRSRPLSSPPLCPARPCFGWPSNGSWAADPHSRLLWRELADAPAKNNFISLHPQPQADPGQLTTLCKEQNDVCSCLSLGKRTHRHMSERCWNNPAGRHLEKSAFVDPDLRLSFLKGLSVFAIRTLSILNP